MKNTSQGGEEKIEYLEKDINWSPEVLIFFMVSFYGVLVVVCVEEIKHSCENQIK